MAIKEIWYNADCEYNFFSIQNLSSQDFDRVCRMHEIFFLHCDNCYGVDTSEANQFGKNELIQNI